MAKKETNILLLLAAAAGAWFIFKDGNAPKVDYSTVDWLNGYAEITMDGEPYYLNTASDIAKGDYTIGFDKNLWPSTDKIEPTAIVVRKKGVIQKIVVSR